MKYFVLLLLNNSNTFHGLPSPHSITENYTIIPKKKINFFCNISSHLSTNQDINPCLTRLSRYLDMWNLRMLMKPSTDTQKSTHHNSDLQWDSILGRSKGSSVPRSRRGSDLTKEITILLQIPLLEDLKILREIQPNSKTYEITITLRLSKDTYIKWEIPKYGKQKSIR